MLANRLSRIAEFRYTGGIRRLPPTVRLERLRTLLEEDVARSLHETTLDIHLVLALVNYAMSYGSFTVGDLDLRAESLSPDFTQFLERNKDTENFQAVLPENDSCI
jgi:hypothetical protein